MVLLQVAIAPFVKAHASPRGRIFLSHYEVFVVCLAVRIGNLSRSRILSFSFLLGGALLAPYPHEDSYQKRCVY
jgi:hypothetical protein